MPTKRNLSSALWGPFLLLGLALGIGCFFLPAGPVTGAVEPDSPLFDRSSPASPGPGNPAAREPLALPAEDPSPAPGLGSVLLRLLLALVLVGGLIFLTVWGLKTLWEKRGWGITGDESKPVKVLATTYLAPRRAVYLLEVGKRILVVGAGNNEMNCLDVVTDPAEVESLRLAAQQGFPKMFSRVLQRQETATQQDEAKRILEESKQVVGGYVEKLKGASPRRKDRPRDPEDEA